MGITYLWDTNIAIYYLQNSLPARGEAFIDQLLLAEPSIVSVITEIELMCWKTEDAAELQKVQTFIDNAIVIELDAAIKSRTATTGVRLLSSCRTLL